MTADVLPPAEAASPPRANMPIGFRPLLAVGVTVYLSNTLDRHYYLTEQAAIVVEVVSPSTRRRDRFDQPADYAACGIKHFWRIEQNPVHAYAYDLGPDGSYVLVADSDTELVLSAPFEIRLPIEAITP